MKYDHDIEFRVHLGFDSDVPFEGEKAQIIAKHLKPHIKAYIKHLEKLVDDFMRLTKEELEDIFSK